MKVSLITAMTPQRIIGHGNRLPWHLPADLAWFKRQTLHKPIMMGRKTYQSIGRPLPNRDNIVLSQQLIREKGITWVSSIAAGLTAAGGAAELMVIGGGQLYQQLLPQADRIYLSLIEAPIDANLPETIFFPDYSAIVWRTCFSDYHPADACNPYPYHFIILERA